MASTDLERRKQVMSELVDDIVEIKRWFASRGIDVGDPVDRETIDEFKRTERLMRAQGGPDLLNSRATAAPSDRPAYQEAGE